MTTHPKVMGLTFSHTAHTFSVQAHKPLQMIIKTLTATGLGKQKETLMANLRGRQANTCFRGVKSTSRKVNTGVPQGSKLSPSLFSFYIADMPIPTEPVKRVCYADELTVWASGVGRSTINYAAPVWSPNLHDTNYRKIQYTQNEALRFATGCHKMSSIDHLHTEAEMLKVKEHSELLSAQYLTRCLEPGNVCHPIITRAIPERQMRETLYTRHRNTVESMMVKMIGKLYSSTPHCSSR